MGNSTTNQNNSFEGTLLTSKETMQALKISACDLMHRREAGKIRFIKRGNAYLYEAEDVKNLKTSKTK